MSRSKHTDPVAIRAERRLRSPSGDRAEGDASRRRRVGRLLKGAGLFIEDVEGTGAETVVEPRFVRRRPQPGYHHPAGITDLRRVLALVGPIATYGLRNVELRNAPTANGTLPPLGRLQVPGRILLFEQPLPPWELRGELSPRERLAVERSGGRVEASPPWVTTIHWPNESLRDFMLFDVFLHEVGHHYLQHHKGKRTVRIARTGDHEAFAESFARQLAEDCREAWLEIGNGT